MVELKPVEGSANVLATGYDPATQTLAVQFKSGIYHYSGVPPEVAQAFAEADSKGRFVRSELVGNYDFQKLEADE